MKLAMYSCGCGFDSEEEIQDAAVCVYDRKCPECGRVMTVEITKENEL